MTQILRWTLGNRFQNFVNLYLGGDQVIQHFRKKTERTIKYTDTQLNS